MEIRNHPDQFTLTDKETFELLTDLGASQDAATESVNWSHEHGFARAPLGKWYVQVDHAGDRKFIVSVHAKRASKVTRDIR